MEQIGIPNPYDSPAGARESIPSDSDQIEVLQQVAPLYAASIGVEVVDGCGTACALNRTAGHLLDNHEAVSSIEMTSQTLAAVAAADPAPSPDSIGGPSGNDRPSTGSDAASTGNSGTGTPGSGGFVELGDTVDCKAKEAAAALSGNTTDEECSTTTEPIFQSCPQGTKPPSQADKGTNPDFRLGKSVQKAFDLAACMTPGFSGITRYGGYNLRCTRTGPYKTKAEAYRKTNGTCNGAGKVSEHSIGRAIDAYVTQIRVAFPRPKKTPWQPGSPQFTAGENLKDWAVKHHNALGLKTVIWNRMIYSNQSGWKARPYNGPDPHYNHVHIDF